MARHCSHVGLALALLFAGMRALPLPQAGAFRGLLPRNPIGAMSRQTKASFQTLTDGSIVPLIWESEMLTLRDPQGNPPAITVTYFPPAGSSASPSSTPVNKAPKACTQVYNGTNFVCVTPSPSPSSCDYIYNGTHLVCKTTTTSAVSTTAPANTTAPAVTTPCVKVFNGTGFYCPTTAPTPTKATSPVATPCVKVFNGTGFFCPTTAPTPTKATAPVVTPCVKVFNGTGFFCPTTAPTPTKATAPVVTPCAKVFNGTGFFCPTTQPAATKPTTSKPTTSKPAATKPAAAKPSATPCVKVFNGTGFFCPSGQPSAPHPAAAAPCAKEFNGTGFACASATPSGACKKTFNGTVFACHSPPPTATLPLGCYTSAAGKIECGRNGTSPAPTPCDLVFNGTHLTCAHTRPSPTPCRTEFNGTAWGCASGAPPPPRPTKGAAPHPAATAPCAPTYNGTGWACPDRGPPTGGARRSPYASPTYAPTAAAAAAVPARPGGHAKPTRAGGPPAVAYTPAPSGHGRGGPGAAASSADPFAELGQLLACFPGGARVRLAGGPSVRMDALAVGDVVQSGAGTYSPVFAFTHADARARARFVRLTLAGGRGALALSPGHFLPLNGKPAPAAAASAGDAVVLADGSPAQVAAVALVPADGLYNPQTLDGAIVVDGVLATTFTAAVRPPAARALLAPAAALFRLAGVDVIGSRFATTGGAFMRFLSRHLLQ